MTECAPAAIEFPGAAFAERYGVGFALLEMRDGRITASAAYSPPAPAVGCPVREDSVFWLGCLSKPMTAVAVMLLVDRGAMALEDPLRRFMPELPPRVGALTVRELLAHMTRLPRNMPGWSSFFDRAWLSEPLASAALRIAEPEANVPGSRTYSSVGYVLLGRLIEVVTSSELGSFMRMEVFEPLQMSDTFCINAIPPHRAGSVPPVLVRKGGAVSVAFEPTKASGIVNSMPFAGFFSTARDVGRFLQMALDGGAVGRRNLVGEAAIARMFHEEVSGQGIHQGLSWFLSFPAAESGPRGSRPCGFWHSSSSGGLIVANTIDRSVLVILGQALLESDLMPVRISEWQHAHRVTMTLPLSPNAPARDDAHPWLQQLGATPAARR